LAFARRLRRRTAGSLEEALPGRPSPTGATLRASRRIMKAITPSSTMAAMSAITRTLLELPVEVEVEVTGTLCVTVEVPVEVPRVTAGPVCLPEVTVFAPEGVVVTVGATDEPEGAAGAAVEAAPVCFCASPCGPPAGMEVTAPNAAETARQAMSRARGGPRHKRENEGTGLTMVGEHSACEVPGIGDWARNGTYVSCGGPPAHKTVEWATDAPQAASDPD
jgi:hypothetical protein